MPMVCNVLAHFTNIYFRLCSIDLIPGIRIRGIAVRFLFLLEVIWEGISANVR